MTPASPAASPRRKRYLRVLAVFILCTLAMALWVARSISDYTEQVEQRLAALRAAGKPVTAQELAALHPPIPDDENAVIFYQAAFMQLQPFRDLDPDLPISGSAELPNGTQPLGDNITNAIQMALDRNRESLRLLHLGARRPDAHWDLGLINGFSNLNRISFVQLRASTFLLSLEAILATHREEPVQATAAIYSLFKLAHSLESDPFYVSWMIRRACESIALDSLEFQLNRTAPDQSRIDDLIGLIEGSARDHGLLRGHDALRAQGIWFIRNVGKLSPASLQTTQSTGLDRFEQWLDRFRFHPDRELILFLDFMDELESIAALPPAEASDMTSKAVEEYLAVAHEEAAWILPNTSRALEAEVRIRMRLRIAALALRIERFRLHQNGRLPDSLDEVSESIDSVPIDPFDDKSIRYRRLESGYLLYSVCFDGQEEVGHVSPTTAEATDSDIRFQVLR